MSKSGDQPFKTSTPTIKPSTGVTRPYGWVAPVAIIIFSALAFWSIANAIDGSGRPTPLLPVTQPSPVINVVVEIPEQDDPAVEPTMTPTPTTQSNPVATVDPRMDDCEYQGAQQPGTICQKPPISPTPTPPVYCPDAYAGQMCVWPASGDTRAVRETE